ncbi:unnamed protein product [marine sediment metagenome]|uniref:Uncharacterized protein n=1 Tax=marine sediment metagenome TaxID=412755 RepID=X1H105_9ZZZZ
MKVGGEIGFDEGGVLDAMRDPFLTRKIKRNKNGKVIEIDDTFNVSVTTIVALLVLYYGPEVLEWFRTSAGGAFKEGLSDLLSGAANYAQEATGGTDPSTGGSPEFEDAMRHSNLGRTGFKDLMARHPKAGAFAGCNPWRRANHTQRKLYREKWGLPTTWQWPGCIGGF